MKNIVLASLGIALIIIMSLMGNLDLTKNPNSDLLRIHIRANSNLEYDQKIKYEIKDLVLETITEDISKLKTKTEVENYFKENKNNLKSIIDTFLLKNGYLYDSNIKLANEYFPTRVYGELLVEQGFYDAIIIELGKAEGQNWWCVAYPPLCFYDYSENINNVVYKSRFMDIINEIFKK